MINIIFKRKSRSLPHFRKKIYTKIGNNYLQEQWKTFLTNEQQMTSILHELSKAEFDIRSQDKFKYTARSILMIKREIIRYIEQNQLQKGKNKLKELHEKVNCGEMKKIAMIIIYLEYKEELEKGIGTGKEEIAIEWLKEKMGQHLNGNDISGIKVKILTILSILLLRFRGILMSNEEKFIIFKTIQFKKKKMLQMDVREERESEFQCLLYLLFQLYKILYLLKKDQQTIHFYYNQLHAYTQIYLNRQENKLYLDVNQINKILASMKPVLNDLDIYEDSKLRKDLAFAHIQQQIIHQESESTKAFEIKNAQEKHRMESSIKMALRQPRRSSFRIDQKLVINHFTNNVRNQEIPKEETVQDVLTIQKKPIFFQFLVVSRQRLYIVSLAFKFRNSCSLFDLSLTIRNKTIMLQIYRLHGIQLAISKLTFRAISRFLQKICELLFKSQYYFRQMHNIYFANSFLPQSLDLEHIVVALARIKTQVGQYLKQNYCCNSLLGSKFSIPDITLGEIKTYFQKEGKVGERKSENSVVSKRKGFTLKENFKAKQVSQVCTRILLKNQNQKYHQYFFLNIYFDGCFKGIQIYYFSQKDDNVDLAEYITKLKKMSSKMVCQKMSVRRLKVISQISSMQVRIEREYKPSSAFKLEEELQINQQKLKPETIPVVFSRSSGHHRPKEKKGKVFQMIKMDKKAYYLFVKEIYNEFMIYINQKAKMYLPLNWKERGWTLVKDRLRVYSGIKIAYKKLSQRYFVKAYEGKQGLEVNSQLIVLSLLRHKLIRKRSGYSILLEYLTQSKEYLYEIVFNKKQRYYFLYSAPIEEWNERVSFDSIMNKYPFRLYQGVRQKNSEANQYYLNVINHKDSLS